MPDRPDGKRPLISSRRCDGCGKFRDTARYDRGTRKHLCNACWRVTAPEYGVTEYRECPTDRH